MSDNVSIIVAMIGGLFCGVSITLAIWAMTLVRKAVREASELERVRGVNEGAARQVAERYARKALTDRA